MPPVVATPEQIGSLVSYLRSLPIPQPGRQLALESVVQDPPPQPEMRPAVTIPAAAIAQPPATPRETAAAVAAAQPSPGRELFVSRGCIGCHGTHAQETQFAPSLVGVAARFPGDKLPNLLRHPTGKMRDGGMPTVTVNDAQMTELVAYLSSLQTSPASSPSAPVSTAESVAAAQHAPTIKTVSRTAPVREVAEAPLSPLAARGKRIFQRGACENCHGVDGMNGTIAAPALAGTASLLPETAIEALLRHHTPRMQQGGMPPTNFKTEDMKAIVAYIRSLTASEKDISLLVSEAPAQKR
jgi:mono/diheme cytochrome c family protein